MPSRRTAPRRPAVAANRATKRTAKRTSRDRYAERREAGLCTRCAAPVADGRATCAECREAMNAHSRASGARRRNSAEFRDRERVRVREAMRQRLRERREAGECQACGAPVGEAPNPRTGRPYARCRACREAMNAERRAARAAARD